MSRVKLIQQTDLSEENKEFFDMVPNLLGRVPNLQDTESFAIPRNGITTNQFSGTA